MLYSTVWVPINKHYLSVAFDIYHFYSYWVSLCLNKCFKALIKLSALCLPTMMFKNHLTIILLLIIILYHTLLLIYTLYFLVRISHPKVVSCRIFKTGTFYYRTLTTSNLLIKLSFYRQLLVFKNKLRLLGQELNSTQ